MKQARKDPISGQMYRSRECAALGGVTVRALHHYDRLGLLSPRRTSAGHRIYSPGDLESLQQIVTLKSIGIPLKDISRLRASGATLANVLRTHRARLEEKSRALARVIAAVREGEEAFSGSRNAEGASLRRIMKAMDLEFSDDQWRAVARATFKHRRSLPPRVLAELQRRWETLLAEVQTVLNEDPAAPRVQELAKRWVDLIQRLNGKAVPLSILMRCGESTYRHLAKRSPKLESSPWGRAVTLMSEAASL